MRRLLAAMVLTFVAFGVTVAAKASYDPANVMIFAGSESGAWSPSENEARRVHAVLEQFIHSSLMPPEQFRTPPPKQVAAWLTKSRLKIAADFKTYRFRISGVPEAVGYVAGPARRLIFVEGICEGNAELMDWRSPDFLVFDGGACFFNVHYDPATGQIVNFNVHGNPGYD